MCKGAQEKDELIQVAIWASLYIYKWGIRRGKLEDVTQIYAAYEKSKLSILSRMLVVSTYGRIHSDDRGDHRPTE